MSAMALQPEEIERYARHLVLRDIGGPGQAKLKAARVLVVGAGGLGAPLIQYLAAAGGGTDWLLGRGGSRHDWPRRRRRGLPLQLAAAGDPRNTGPGPPEGGERGRGGAAAQPA